MNYAIKNNLAIYLTPTKIITDNYGIRAYSLRRKLMTYYWEGYKYKVVKIKYFDKSLAKIQCIETG